MSHKKSTNIFKEIAKAGRRVMEARQKAFTAKLKELQAAEQRKRNIKIHNYGHTTEFLHAQGQLSSNKTDSSELFFYNQAQGMRRKVDHMNSKTIVKTPAEKERIKDVKHAWKAAGGWAAQ